MYICRYVYRLIAECSSGSQKKLAVAAGTVACSIKTRANSHQAPVGSICPL